MNKRYVVTMIVERRDEQDGQGDVMRVLSYPLREQTSIEDAELLLCSIDQHLGDTGDDLIDERAWDHWDDEDGSDTIDAIAATFPDRN